MKINAFKVVLVSFLILFAVLLSACQAIQMREYYSEKGNYITATGTVSHISIDEEKRILYIDFSELSPSFDDTCFKIVGSNFVILRQKGIVDSLRKGDTIEFVSAPRYFGDGYIMPIVSISIAGECVLEFEEGLTNFLEWQN